MAFAQGHLLKNLQVGRVVLPDPLTCTTYWSNLADLHYDSCLVWLWTGLILDVYMVVNCQHREQRSPI